MISFVCGQLCSGKTLYSRALAHTSSAHCIEVGDVVRMIKISQDRKVLQNSKDLSGAIVDWIKKSCNEHTELVVSGVRQKEILENFPNSTLLWIECPINTRKERYQKRARVGDTQTFEEAEQGDINLGIFEVKNYIFSK